jgi:DNA gyrase subunit B
MLAKYKLIEEYLKPPYLIEIVTKAKAEKSADIEPEALENELDTTTGSGVQKEVQAKTPKPRKGEPVEKLTTRDLFEYVLNEGRREYQVQRYKGLGEMTSAQLWETTMNPEIRTLLQVKLEDIAETEHIFTTLMGEDVESRRKFIEENALDVKNLDI